MQNSGFGAFKTILYIVGQDIEQERGVADQVSRLARANDAEVTIVRIEEDSHLEQLDHVLGGRYKELVLAACARQHDELQAFAASAQFSSIACRAQTLTGKGFISVIRKVLRDSHDLVVIGTHLHSGVGQLAMRLIRKCPCPVWVIKKYHQGPFTSLLASLDVGDTNPESRALNRRILDLAASYEPEPQQLRCLHAWQLVYEALLRGPGMDPSMHREARQQIEAQRRTALTGMLEDYGQQTTKMAIDLVEGPAVQVIEELIERAHIELLIMGSLGKTGIPGLLIGDLAEEILQKIACSVLVVKPEGFVSPVRI